jgi:catechol-2,3-dioxygenase
MSHSESLENSSVGEVTKPAYISHYGIRTLRYKEMIQWYKTVFRAKIQHQNEFLAFMTFDEEHHRLVANHLGHWSIHSYGVRH